MYENSNCRLDIIPKYISCKTLTDYMHKNAISTYSILNYKTKLPHNLLLN